MPATDAVHGTALVLDRSNIDTDQIIPASRLKRVERAGYADDLFYEWRTDPAFALHQPHAATAQVLVAGRNFGCGSSREHAVWALLDFGFRAVVSEQIADIFRGNAITAGLIPVELPADQVAAIIDALAQEPTRALTIDLVRRRVSVHGTPIDVPLTLDPDACATLRAGADPITLTLQQEQTIADYENTRPAWMPTTANPTVNCLFPNVTPRR
jgi:3-isopropylmalate/(R)-2-methylmalate dehydratase small subunit